MATAGLDRRLDRWRDLGTSEHHERRESRERHHSQGDSDQAAKSCTPEQQSQRQPHTITIARRSDLPQNIAQLNACYDPGALCAETIEAHDPGSDFTPPFNFRVNRGGPGLDARGDSLLFAGPVNQAIQGQVTAPAGRTLYYLCVVHPWMQGSITVQ